MESKYFLFISRPYRLLVNKPLKSVDECTTESIVFITSFTPSATKQVDSFKLYESLRRRFEPRLDWLKVVLLVHRGKGKFMDTDQFLCVDCLHWNCARLYISLGRQLITSCKTRSCSSWSQLIEDQQAKVGKDNKENRTVSLVCQKIAKSFSLWYFLSVSLKMQRCSFLVYIWFSIYVFCFSWSLHVHEVQGLPSTSLPRNF